MGLYNLIRGRMTCPGCDQPIEAEVETRAGFTHRVQTLHVGDVDPWNHPEMPSLRPDGGNAVGDGYCVCPACGRDFFVNVVIEGDVVRRLGPDETRPGMM